MREDIQSEFRRWLGKLGEDKFSSQHTLGHTDVLHAHFIIVDFFLAEGRDLGGIGPRDTALLESALARQFDPVNGAGPIDFANMAATLLFGLVNNHPFHDANKRTALLCCLFLLQRFGYYPTITDRELEDFTVEVAEKKFRTRRRYKSLAKKSHQNPDVEYIRHYLKKHQKNRQAEISSYFPPT